MRLPPKKLANMAKRLVLDTNVVLDWLVFGDHAVDVLVGALAAGVVNLVSHDAAVEELRRVLGYSVLKLNEARQQSILAEYRSWIGCQGLPFSFGEQNLLLPSGFPRCRDPDDQLFLALAYHARATLLSRDRAILTMSKRLGKFGVQVIDISQLAGWLHT